MAPLLSIGCPTFRDFGRTLFTLQSLRIGGCAPPAGQLLRLPPRDEVEFLCVDNDPGGPHSRRLAEECGAAGISYFAEQAQGTCPAKNAVFASARGEWVLCIDAHVLFPPGLVDRLLAFCRANPASRDLYHAPLYNTHLGDGSLMTDHALYGEETREALWSGGMWGQWRDRPNLKPGWSACDLSKPVEVESNGCWFLLMRREAWPGFHCQARGFGGEEGAIQEIVRSRGGKVYTHPAFAGWHSFEAPNCDGSQRRDYPVNTENMLINYALNLRKADRPLGEMRAYFLGEAGVSEREWEAYMKEVERREKAGCGCGQSAAPQLTPGGPTPVPERVQVSAAASMGCAAGPQVVVRRRDLREQAQAALAVCPPSLAGAARKAGELAEGRAVLEVCAVRTVASLGVQASASSLVSRCRLTTGTRKLLLDGEEGEIHLGGWGDPLPDACDLAVLHALPGPAELAAWLSHLAQVRPGRVLVLGTSDTPEPRREPWALGAIRDWLRARPDYSVCDDSSEGAGWTLLSRLGDDLMTLPSAAQQAWSFSKAVFRHLAGGAVILPDEEIQKRLDVCLLCKVRVGNRCGRCGCPLDAEGDNTRAKAFWASESCPLGRWPLPLAQARTTE